NEEKDGFSIYPNPATNQFSIDADLTIKTSVQILNYNGQLVKEVNQLKHSNQIDISDLNSGIYFVNVLINDSFLVEKLIIR
ncbi:T9SS type A sorting domain-containing protein, partial [Vicingaceae bacterium]|nr:T9SS type A sorting domain-containing protein [Vicingaceae bacterium]